MPTAITIAAIVIVVVLIFATIIPVGLWISALASGVRIGIFALVGMKIRRVRPAKIVTPMIKATKAGLKVRINELEAHYLAGGNVDDVVNALIAAERAGMALSFEKASAAMQSVPRTRFTPFSFAFFITSKATSSLSISTMEFPISPP